MNSDAFLKDLTEVLKKHKVWPSGSIKLRELNGEWDEKTANCIITASAGNRPYIDISGPFINFSIIPVESKITSANRKVTTVIMDKDKLLANGVLSPLDMKTAFHNRRDYAEHLKANGCVEIGNDFNKSTEKKREIVGDFDCRSELAQAVNQAQDKYGN
jgi:hypothetical protein